MRRRLLLSTLAVAVVSVLLLGIPLAYSTERLIYDEAQQQVEREAATVVAGVNLREEMRQSITGDQIAKEFPGRYILVTMADGTQISAGEAPAKGDHVITKMAANDRGIHVQVSRDAADVEADAVRTFLLIGSLVVLGVGVAVALAMVQARKLTLPLIDLAETADRLGSGHAPPRPRRFRPPGSPGAPPAGGAAATACRRSTVWPRCSTAAPCASPTCWPRAGSSPPTP